MKDDTITSARRVAAAGKSPPWGFAEAQVDMHERLVVVLVFIETSLNAAPLFLCLCSSCL